MTGEVAFGFPLAHAALRLWDMRAMAALLLVVAACGGVTVTEEFSEIGDAPLPAEVSERIVEDASERVDVPKEEIEVASVQPATFKDSSLGCPDVEGEGGEVEGHRVVLRVTDGELDYRVDGEGGFLLCVSTSSAIMHDEVSDDGSSSPEAVTGEVPEDVMAAIVADAAERLNVASSQLEIIRAEQVIWNDGSLGCPEPGVMYTQAIVEGYWVVVGYGDDVLDYRATAAGFWRLCEGAQPRPPSG
jgi:hypothetical protein